jgi:prephenate dehydrogenase
MKASVHWPRIAIVGVGLIGGSVGLAALSRRLAGSVIGVGRSTGSLAEAKRAGAVTETTTNLAAAVAEADLVVVATGVAAIPAMLDAIDAAVRPGTLITDAGSTKQSIVASWEKRRRSRRGRFVGGHPIAGSHRRGPAAADAKLFAGRVTVVTPAKATPAADVEEVGGFWAALGSTVFVMPPRGSSRPAAGATPRGSPPAIPTSGPTSCSTTRRSSPRRSRGSRPPPKRCSPRSRTPTARNLSRS